MEYVNLGASGVKVSRICLGCMTYGARSWREWVLEEEESRPFIRRALESGVNFFDTADVYSLGRSEEILGKALRDFGPGRAKIVIATKVFNAMGDDPNLRGLSRKHILHSIEGSLRRLKTDYVDLYQIHRFDPFTPIEETLDVLNDIVRSGKALYIGASSMFAWQFARMLCAADRRGLSRFITMQNHYNLLYREEEREMIPLCTEEGIGILPWSPLARGLLTRALPAEGFGNTTRARTDEYAHKMYYRQSDHAVVQGVSEIAGKRGVSMAKVALAWLLHQPGVTAPIVGASRMEHLVDAVEALEVKLSGEEREALTSPYEPHPVSGHE
jgi:aryl-alcohol dehydrogenase-like predicted oxidoreductase